MMNFDDEGYDFYIASKLDKWHTENLDLALGKDDAMRFEKIIVPKGTYVVCETDRTQYPTKLQESLRRKIVTEWLPSSGYQISNAPEISVAHWFYEYENRELSNSRYIELWIPIEKE